MLFLLYTIYYLSILIFETICNGIFFLIKSTCDTLYFVLEVCFGTLSSSDLFHFFFSINLMSLLALKKSRKDKNKCIRILVSHGDIL